MNELEQRLRSAFAELAEEVPPSRHAWADQERRLALKSVRDRRRPVLMASVAAAVVALIALPVLLLNLRPAALEAAGPSPSTTVQSPPVESRTQVEDSRPKYQPDPGETVLIDPVLVLGQSENRPESVYAYAITRAGRPQLCTASKVDTGTGKVLLVASDSQRSCVPLTAPKAGRVVWLEFQVPTVESYGTYIYLASHPTSRLLVRKADGGLAVAEKRGTGPDFDLFTAFLGSNQPPTAYTAKDTANATLEDGP